MPKIPGRYLTGKQVAELFGCAVPTVRAMGERGELLRRRTKGGHWRYLEADVRRYIVEGETRAELHAAIERGDL